MVSLHLSVIVSCKSVETGSTKSHALSHLFAVSPFTHAEPRARPKRMAEFQRRPFDAVVRNAAQPERQDQNGGNDVRVVGNRLESTQEVHHHKVIQKHAIADVPEEFVNPVKLEFRQHVHGRDA